MATLPSHSQCTTALCWRDPVGEQLFSASADGVMRVVDSRTAVVLNTMARAAQRARGAAPLPRCSPTRAPQEGSKRFNAIDYSPSARLVAAAHPDNVVRMWDDRASGALQRHAFLPTRAPCGPA